MAAAAAVVLLVAVLLRRGDRAALRYAALTLAFGLWNVGRGASRLGFVSAAPVEGISLALIGPLALAFAAELAGPVAFLRRVWPAALVGSVAACAATLLTGYQPLWVRSAVSLWAAAGTLASAALLWRARPVEANADAPEETRLRYLATSQWAVPLGIAADVALLALDGPRVGALFGGLVYLYMGHLHLARIRVPDLRQLIGNAAALGLMALGLAAVFAGLRAWVGERVDLFAFDAFVASFLLLLFYRPIRELLQGAIERRFVAAKLELERSVLPLCERLPKLSRLDDLLSDLLSTLEQTRRVTASAIFLREDPDLGFQPVASFGARPRASLIRDASFEVELEAGEPLLCEEIEKALAEARTGDLRERLDGLRRKLRELDAQLVLPMRAGGRLIGFWTLTDAGSREAFSTTEVRLLRSVADQAAVSVENSKTFERIRVRDRLVALGEMAAGLAHEIRNPLAAIHGALAVMEEAPAGGRAEFEAVIVEELQRLDRVVTLFLDYARPSVRRAPIHDAGEFVRSCVEAVARRHAKEAVELAIDVAPELPPISADVDQLETVIGNVVQNAYEALEGRGRIAVSVRAVRPSPDASPRVEVAVEDDGPGMDEQTLERALVPFFTTKARGTGLGLAICERLLREQGGAISVRSKLGQGTSIVIRLPEQLPDAREAA